MGKTKRAAGAVLAAAAVSLCILGGCAGPSTRILPGGQEAPQEPRIILPDMLVLEEANPFYLQEALGMVAGVPCPKRQEGEEQIVSYLQQMLTDYGYEVTLQNFQTWEPEGGSVQRSNVVAVRGGSSPDADIILVGSCHGVAEGSPGAVHSASGMVAMLETARLLSSLPTDTELRFVSFADRTGAEGGARRYLAGLTEEEALRMIGVVHLGPMGYYTDPRMVLKTDDGKSTLLGDLFKEAAGEIPLAGWKQQEQGIPSLFVRRGIPAVEVRQMWDAYEAGSPYDRPELVDIERVAQVVNALARVLSDIMSADTPSLHAKSRFYNNLHEGEYVQKEESSIRFGESHEETDNRLGMTGIPVTENQDSEGRAIHAYQYHMKWFNVDQVILTRYYYQDNRLVEIALDSDGAGVGLEETKERVSEIYGIPWAGSAGPNGVEYHWEDPVYRLHFTLAPASGGYELNVVEYDAPMRELYAGPLPAREETAEGSGEEGGAFHEYQKPGADADSPEISLWADGGAYDTGKAGVRQILESLRDVYPQELEGYLESVHVYTDGIGANENYLEPVPGTDGQAPMQFRLWVDWNDVLRRDGSFRDRTAFISQMLVFQGQILEQVEGGFYKESFDTALNIPRPEPEPDPDTRPLTETGVGPGQEPEEYPDFVESYKWFILADSGLEGTDPLNLGLRFFYGLENLTRAREKIRGYLYPDNSSRGI